MSASPEYDDQVVQMIARMERVLERLHLRRYGHFAGILNAIENHVEEGEGVPAVVRHLGDAVLALAIHDGLPVATVQTLTRMLADIHDHVVTEARAR